MHGKMFGRIPWTKRLTDRFRSFFQAAQQFPGLAIFKSAFKNFGRFMIQKPSNPSSWQQFQSHEYYSKARFFAFLPPIEEARAWLRRMYGQN